MGGVPGGWINCREKALKLSQASRMPWGSDTGPNYASWLYEGKERWAEPRPIDSTVKQIQANILGAFRGKPWHAANPSKGDSPPTLAPTHYTPQQTLA